MQKPHIDDWKRRKHHINARNKKKKRIIEHNDDTSIGACFERDDVSAAWRVESTVQQCKEREGDGIYP